MFFVTLASAGVILAQSGQVVGDYAEVRSSHVYTSPSSM